MSDFKQAVGSLAKVGCGLAGLVFLVAPITTKHGLEVCGGALAAALIFGGLWQWAKAENQKDKDCE
jgi:predicted branched-subunit amino acid permease